MSGGRPSLYDPAYCERVVALGASGMSVLEMAVEIGVARNTLETVWPASHPEFLEALTQAREASQAWWERQGRENLVQDPGGRTINASLYSRSMAARFPKDWREVKGTELSGPDGGPINVKAEKAEWVIIDPTDTGGA